MILSPHKMSRTRILVTKNKTTSILCCSLNFNSYISFWPDRNDRISRVFSKFVKYPVKLSAGFNLNFIINHFVENGRYLISENICIKILTTLLFKWLKWSPLSSYLCFLSLFTISLVKSILSSIAISLKVSFIPKILQMLLFCSSVLFCWIIFLFLLFIIFRLWYF